MERTQRRVTNASWRWKIEDAQAEEQHLRTRTCRPAEREGESYDKTIDAPATREDSVPDYDVQRRKRRKSPGKELQLDGGHLGLTEYGDDNPGPMGSAATAVTAQPGGTGARAPAASAGTTEGRKMPIMPMTRRPTRSSPRQTGRSARNRRVWCKLR